MSWFQVEHRGLAYRAGIRPGDTITRINNVYTDDMTLREAQRLIRKSGRFVQIFVQGFVVWPINSLPSTQMELWNWTYRYSYYIKIHIYVTTFSDAEIEKTNEYTVDFWFKPRKRFPPIHVVSGTLLKRRSEKHFIWHETVPHSERHTISCHL